jgi:predicted Zn finger-like uncharacterized protein
MHGITRCPECHTAFNVAQHHISKAKGKVRCGVCKHTFNATEHWVSAELDDADLAFERPDIFLNSTPTWRHNNVIAGFILILGLATGYAQWQQAPNNIALQHYVAQIQGEHADLITITGIVTSESARPQPHPDMLLSLHLVNDQRHSARIPAQHIHFNAPTLSSTSPTSFSFTIKRPSSEIDTFTLTPCCQQKN